MNNKQTPIGGTELMYNELRQRLPEYFEKYSIFNYPYQADQSKKLIYWNQLSYDQSAVQFLSDGESIDIIDKFVFVSHWQSEKFRQIYNIPGIKIDVIKNACIGVPDRKIVKKSADDVVKICYTSTPWRGLDVLLSAWELLKPVNAELHIFSSTKIYGDDFAATEDSKYNVLYERAKQLPGVVYRGFVPNEDLRNELVAFDILAYPNTFEETSCISVIEALSAGLRVITSNLGALPETTEGWARLYPYMINGEFHAQRFSKILNEEIENIRSGYLIQRLNNQIKHYKENWSWDARVKDWVNLFSEVDNVQLYQ